MRFVPLVAALLVLSQAAAAVVLVLTGPWVVGLLLAVASVCAVIVGLRVRFAARRIPAPMDYVERERVGY